MREADTGEVVYVGESHTGRLWKTLLRHFHAQASFAAVDEWVYDHPENVDVRLWITRTGEQAKRLETEKILSLEPSGVTYAYVPRDNAPPAPF